MKDTTAQDLLWEYAQRRRAVDAEFSDDLETALLTAGYQPRTSKGPCLTTDSAARKAIPIYSGVVAYFHDALAALAELPPASDAGNYADGVAAALIAGDWLIGARDALALLQELEEQRLGRAPVGSVGLHEGAWTIFARYPLALAAVAEVSFAGNQKHNPGEPLGWARAKSADHADCVARHLIDHRTLTDGRYKDAAELAWRELALLQEHLEREEGLPHSRGSR